MRPGTLKSSGPIKRYAPIKRASAKKRKEMRLRREAMAVVKERSGGWCELRIEGVCTGYAAKGGHEPLLRSRGGDATDPEEIKDACPACHRWVHRNVTKATAMGFMISRYSTSARRDISP